MATASISTAVFSQFVTTSGPDRPRVVREATRGQARDRYQRIRSGIVTGIRTGDLTTPVWASVTNAPPGMRRHFQAVAQGYEPIAPAFAGATYLPRHTGHWPARRLGVNVTPHLRLAYPDGRKELVWMHLKDSKPTPLEIDVVLWLLWYASDELLQDAEPVFVDVRDSRVIRAGRSLKKVTEGWLSAEAAGYAELRDLQDDAAA